MRSKRLGFVISTLGIEFYGVMTLLLFDSMWIYTVLTIIGLGVAVSSMRK